MQAIASGKSICRPNLLLEVTGLITKYTQKVNLVWLSSHIGIKGNELADTLAGPATVKPDIDINIGLELSEAYNLVDRYIVRQEGQHPLTGQRAPPISGGTYRRRRTLIDGYLESPFPTACLL